MSIALAFPNIDPIIFSIGPLALRWYALAYVAGLMLGWRLMRHLVTVPPRALSQEQVDDFLLWATLGVILGGRFGYVLFYKPAYYFAHPLDILRTWEGGMSFHGGLLGVVIAALLFVRKHRLDPVRVGDVLGVVAPIGLFFGRIANFINGELFGRAGDVPWAFVFPHGGPQPRHPSQLYEAGLEGAVLFGLMILLWRRDALRLKPGFLMGTFLIGYGVARIVAEFFREPDAHIGFLAAGVTMGQLLSLPMIAVGLWFLIRARRSTP